MLDGSFFNNCLSLFYEREKHSILDLDLNISILDLNIISKKVLKLISQNFSTYEYGLYQGCELNSTSPYSVQMRGNMDRNMDHMLFTVTFFFDESVVNMLELSTRMYYLAKN